MIWQNNTCRSQVTTPFEFCFSCWIFVKVFALISFSCYINGVVKFQTWISLNWYIWISLSCYMDLFKLIHMDLSCCMDFSILIFGFVTYICQSCSMHSSPFARQNQAEVWPRFQSLLKLLLWTKGVAVGWFKELNALGPLCLWQCLTWEGSFWWTGICSELQ